MKFINVVKRSLMLLAIATITVTSALSAQTGTGTITSGNSYRTSAGGWYTSPYKATFTVATHNNGYALPTTNTLYDIFCVDFYHHGQSYGANFSNLADVESIEHFTRKGNVADYTMVAWLASQLETHPNANGVINAAIWQVMGVSEGTFLGYTQAQIDVWKDHTGTVNAAEWVVITDTAVAKGNFGVYYSNGQYVGQEFVTRVQVTPEPVTMLLLGSGLMIMLIGTGVLRRPLV